METMQAKYEGGLDRLRADMAKRETRLIFAMIATVGIGLAIFGFVTS